MIKMVEEEATNNGSDEIADGAGGEDERDVFHVRLYSLAQS